MTRIDVRTPALFTLFVAASALGGCACPSVGMITQVDVALDRGPMPGETWELEVSLDGEPPCTYLLASDDVRVDPAASGCAGVPYPYLRSTAPYIVGGVAEGVVTGVELLLTIDGAVAVAGSFDPTYSTTHPEGPLCPDDTDGLIELQLPPG